MKGLKVPGRREEHKNLGLKHFLARPSRKVLLEIFWSLPDEYRTPNNYCILFLPDAFRSQGFAIAPKLAETWLFGANNDFRNTLLQAPKDFVTIVFLDYETFRDDQAFNLFDSSLIESLSNKVRETVKSSDSHSYLKAIATSLAITSSTKFGLPSVLDKPFFDKDLDLLRKNGAYLGKVSHSGISAAIFEVLKAQFPSDYVASLGSNGIDVWAAGTITRDSATSADVSINQIAYLFNDSYDFYYGGNRGHLLDDQILMRWHPDFGLSYDQVLNERFGKNVVAPILRNSDFGDFGVSVKMAVNERVGYDLLICKDFRIRSNVKKQTLQTALNFKLNY